MKKIRKLSPPAPRLQSVRPWIASLSLAGLAVVVALSSSAFGQTEKTTAERAIKAYQAAQDFAAGAPRLEAFRRAQRLFEQLLDEQISRGETPSASLQVAFANSAYQARRRGPAVLGYARALAIDPDHPQALRNLRELRRELAAEDVPVPNPPADFGWLSRISSNEGKFAAAILFSVAILCLALGIALRVSALRLVSLALLVGWGGALAYLKWRPVDSPRAVILAPITEGRESDALRARRSFDLVGGTEVRVLEERGDWMRVELADRSNTWIHSRDVGRTTQY